MTKAAMEQVPGGDQRVESPAVLERLEFGKFCVSRDGPILEGAGHTLLGLSPQFPPDLVASCHPDVLGLAPNGASADSEGFLSLKQPYGTVIRPVLSTQAGSGRQVALRLAYRVGIRSEGGDHNLSRRYYKLGSYLAETCGHLNPLTLVQALPPLQGFVRDDKDNKAIAALRPITCAGTGSQAAAAENFLCSSRVDPDLRGKHENFLQGAIIAVMSAVPLHIEADEDTFFGLVDMLWEKLPGGLVQDLLSAGWNVASHFSGRLCITFSHGPSPNCAYYDARGGRWKTSPPAAYDLGPGTRYYQARFDATNASIDELVRDATNALKVDANSTAANTALARYPDLTDDATRKQFRDNGLERLSDLLLAALAQWIDGASEITEDKIDNIVRYFLNRPAPQDGNGPAYRGLFETLRKTPPTDSTRKPLDLLAIKCLEHKETVFQHEDWQSYPRWKLFSVAYAGNPNVILSWAALVAASGHLPFPQKIEGKLQDLFPKTLNQRYIEAHRELLREPPDLYWRLIQKYYLLAVPLWIAYAPDLLQTLLPKILVTSPEEARILGAVRRLVDALPPEEGDLDVLLTRWRGVEYFTIFVRALEGLWTKHTSNETRDHLARWAAQFQSKGPNFSISALRLAAKEEEQLTLLDHGSMWEWAEIPFLRNLVAAKVVSEPQRSAFYLSMRSQPEVWSKILISAPPQARLLLLGKCSSGDSARPDLEQGQTWKIQDRSLEEMAYVWGADGAEKHPCFVQAAQILCDKSLQMNSERNSPTLQVMHDLQEGDWSDKRQLNEEQIKHACSLLRGGNRLPGPDTRQRLWNAARTGWQLQLLLSLFPKNDFIPLPEHWTPLVAIRAWLQEAGLKTGRFAPAFYEFYDPYNSDPLPPDQWKPEYENTVLWATFGKAPPPASPERQEQVLKEAFEYYGGTEYGKANCCRLFLAYRRKVDTKENFLKHWKLAVSAFVLPTLSQGLYNESEILIFRDLLEAFGKTRKGFWSSGEWELKLVPGEGAKAVQKVSGEIRLADWMYLLLFEVCWDNRLGALIDLARERARKNPAFGKI